VACAAAFSILDSIAEHAHLAVAATDGAGKIAYWSRRCEILLGYSREEILGKPMEALYPVEDSEATEFIQRLYSSGAYAQRKTGRRIHKDGRRIPLMISPFEVPCVEAEPLRAVLYSEPTEPEELEAFLSTDGGHRIRYWSPGAERLFGYSSAEILDEPVSRLYATDGNPEDGAIFPDKNPHEEKRRCLAKNGRVFDAYILYWSSFSADGGFLKRTGLIRDLSQSRFFERVRNRFFADLVFNHDDAIFTCDDTNAIRTWNPGAERMFGYKASEMLGRNVSILIPHGDPATAGAFLAAVVGEGRVVRYESHRLRKDGTLLPVSGVLSPLKDADGHVMGVSAVLRDATQQVQARLELQDAHDRMEEKVRSRTAELESAHADLERRNSELARSNAELSQFAYIASHDLQEPLRKILSFGELLQRDLGELPPPAKRDLDFMSDAARRMGQLIQDLLALSRVRPDRMHADKVRADTCLDRALEALALRIAESGAEIRREPLPDLLGDATLLTQLFQNLISNALKFRGALPPVVHIDCSSPGNSWRFRVRDNGIGIQERYLEQIFAPFRRLNHRSDFEGTGIGLAICRKAVELHGGTIWAESQGEGKGATFMFEIPREGNHGQR
jgi:PAS domain S-box-containing protein